MTTKHNSHYLKVYGVWGGNPKGSPPDFSRCCANVFPGDRWMHGQCGNKCGYGPDGAYCRRHDPAVVEARRDAVRARQRDKWNSERYQVHGRTFFNALLEIAEGHNDPRALARQVVDEFNAGAEK